MSDPHAWRARPDAEDFIGPTGHRFALVDTFVNHNPCGRPLKSDPSRTCGRGPATKSPNSVGIFSPWAWQASACAAHMTKEEKGDWLALIEMQQCEMERARSTREPACWSWPRPDQWPGDDDSLERESAMRAWQNGRCALCGRRGDRFVDDHDHATGLIRGELCHSCNVLEGKSDFPVFQRYRECNPASIWRLRVEYVDPFAYVPWDEGAVARRSVEQS